MAGRRLEAGVGGWCPLVVHSAGQFRLNHESDLLLDLVLGEGKVVDRGSWELQLLLLLELLQLVWEMVLNCRGRGRDGLT